MKAGDLVMMQNKTLCVALMVTKLDIKRGINAKKPAVKRVFDLFCRFNGYTAL